MQPDVTELLTFYERPLGAVVRRILSQHIRARWQRIPGATLIGLGFALPYLGSFRGEVARLGALMPVAQGASIWPQVGPVCSVSCDELHLPLPDNSVDNLLAVHCLEASENVRLMLREIWRVLQPEGRLLLIVPNRRGVWARMDTTPFGHGRPYSAGQLGRLLADHLFTPLDWETALFLPPVDRRLILRASTTLERAGRRVSPAFAGVIVVEARKELVAPLTEAASVRRAEALVPRGAAAARREGSRE